MIWISFLSFFGLIEDVFDFVCELGSVGGRRRCYWASFLFVILNLL